MNQIERIKKFIELRSSGHSLRDIASVVGISTHTLVKWNRKYCNVVFEVQSEELNAYKKKILQDKLSRLEYLNSRFSLLKDRLENTEMMIRYDRMLLLLMKISKSIDECEKNVILSEISGKIDDFDKKDIFNDIKAEENVENLSEKAK
jgi:hypothetical protein